MSAREGATTPTEQKWIVQYWIHEKTLHWHRSAVASYPFLRGRGRAQEFWGFSYGGGAEVGKMRATVPVEFDVPVGEGLLRYEGEGGEGGMSLPTLPEYVEMKGTITPKDGKWR